MFARNTVRVIKQISYLNVNQTEKIWNVDNINDGDRMEKNCRVEIWNYDNGIK